MRVSVAPNIEKKARRSSFFMPEEMVEKAVVVEKPTSSIARRMSCLAGTIEQPPAFMFQDAPLNMIEVPLCL